MKADRDAIRGIVESALDRAVVEKMGGKETEELASWIADRVLDALRARGWVKRGD